MRDDAPAGGSRRRPSRVNPASAALLGFAQSDSPVVVPGSRSATLSISIVATIPQKELRNNIAEVLRRAEAGEEFTITVSGRPVAHLGPAAKRRWVGTAALREVFGTPAPETLAEDLKRLPTELADPFA